MKVINFPNINKDFLTNQENNTIVLGGFDSMHIGHLELFKKALKKNANAIISIIENPEDLPNNINNKLIFSLKSRLDILNSIGAKNILLISFNESIKNMEPNIFIDILKEKYFISNIIVGKDYRLGKNAKWNVNHLKTYFKNVEIVELKKISNIKIGSTVIREMIQTGEISYLNKLLIRFFSININLDSSFLFIFPKNITKLHYGIYACLVYIKNTIYHALVLISKKEKNEIYFFNYKYEKPVNDIRISFIQQIRIIIKDSDSQILEKDKKITKQFLLNYDKINQNSDLIW